VCLSVVRQTLVMHQNLLSLKGKINSHSLYRMQGLLTTTLTMESSAWKTQLKHGAVYGCLTCYYAPTHRVICFCASVLSKVLYFGASELWLYGAVASATV